MSQVTIANPVTVVEVDATSCKVITQTAFGYYGSFICTLGLDPASTSIAYEVGYNTTIKANGISIVNNISNNIIIIINSSIANINISNRLERIGNKYR